MVRMPNILFEGESEFSRYRVIELTYEGRPARVLYGEHASPQSGMALDDDPELLFDYNQRFLEIIASIQPKHVLVIGGGVFMLPAAAIRRFHDMTIDVVELDPLLPELARKYFDLPDDPRLKAIVGDGRDYVEKCEITYDLIIIDAFSGFDIPRRVISREAAAAYARHLSKDGLVAANFIAAYHTYRPTLAHELSATFSQIFGAVELYPADPTYERRPEQNMVLVAALKEIPALDYLQSAPVELLITPENVVLHDET